MIEELTNDEIRERLAKLRQVNRDFDAGLITWAERIERHNEIAPGIGSLEHQIGRYRKGEKAR